MHIAAAAFSDYIVFVDESGDHGLARVDPDYPIFVLAHCLFRKDEYVQKAGPALQNLKFRYWGHDEQVLHEHEIRKPNRNYGFLFNPATRAAFIEDLNKLVAGADFMLVAAVIKKTELAKQYSTPDNPYEIALTFGLERLCMELKKRGQGGKVTHVVVEARGKKEDDQLELAFRRICDGENRLGEPLPFRLVMVPKTANSAGLQLADLVARPIGIKVLRPGQQNRAYDIVEGKFRRDQKGSVNGWGLKTFP